MKRSKHNMQQRLQTEGADSLVREAHAAQPPARSEVEFWQMLAHDERCAALGYGGAWRKLRDHCIGLGLSAKWTETSAGIDRGGVSLAHTFHGHDGEGFRFPPKHLHVQQMPARQLVRLLEPQTIEAVVEPEADDKGLHGLRADQIYVDDVIDVAVEPETPWWRRATLAGDAAHALKWAAIYACGGAVGITIYLMFGGKF